MLLAPGDRTRFARFGGVLSMAHWTNAHSRTRFLDMEGAPESAFPTKVLVSGREHINMPFLATLVYKLKVDLG